MAIIDEILAANLEYARGFPHGGLPMRPARKLAVVACMDCRQAVFQMLGLKQGDAHIIRNAGGIVTDDVLRSLIVSHHLQGTQEFMILNHTDCGLLTFKDEEFRQELHQRTGKAAATPAHFYAFPNLEANVREQVQKVKSHPWMTESISVRGFIYDVKTGRLNEVPA